MKIIKEIFREEELVAQVFDLLNIPEGLDFLTEDGSFIQVGTWNYKMKTKLPAHFHNDFERTSMRTQEVVIVLSGKIKCNLYTKKGELIDSVILDQNKIIIQYADVHEYELLEDSKVLEVKNGPYFGPDKDRTRVDVEED